MQAPTIDLSKPIDKPADLVALLEQELEEVREVCEQIPGGRSRLAEFLGVRPPEVSRFLNSPGYQPDGRFIVGMRAFVSSARRHLAAPAKPKKRPAPAKK